MDAPFAGGVLGPARDEVVAEVLNRAARLRLDVLRRVAELVDDGAAVMGHGLTRCEREASDLECRIEFFAHLPQRGLAVDSDALLKDAHVRRPVRADRVELTALRH